MEELISLIPEDLKRMIGRSAPEDLVLTCSLLMEFLRPLPEFQRVIRELTDPEMALCRKSEEVALELKKKGNECFSKGECENALSLYSRALRTAPMNTNNMDKDLILTLFVNRASTLHKLGLSEECLRDCNRAVAISPLYSKAWYRRGKANALSQNYDIAIRDLEVALSIERSSSGKRHIKEELDAILHNSNGFNGTDKSRTIDEDKNSANLAEQDYVALQCVSTPSKGRGMTCRESIRPAVLVHSEEPLAAIVEKSCRETHCHFCFNELPADPLFCTSCTIPMYCSQHCQERAGAKQFKRNIDSCNIQMKVSAHLERHIMDSLAANDNECAVTDISIWLSSEHKHECGGVHWPVVLPSNVVLAGRVMAKCLEKRPGGKPIGNLEFAHNFLQVPPGSKLELHIYSVVLSYCLNIYYGSDFPSTGVSASQLVILISQVQVNSMSIVHMVSFDGYGAFMKSASDSAMKNAHICDVEQLVEKDPEKAIALFWAAINAGDRVDSALKDMAIVMKQQSRAEEAIEAIKSLRSRCSEQAQESLDDILLDLYKRCGRLDDQIALLKHKLHLIQQGLAFNGKRTKTARSQGRKFQVSLEQEVTRLLVKVGQAIYSTGSLFNHSCRPNIHAYFISRKLFLRSTEYVQGGYPLELSYGPQVGQWDLQNRQKLLKQQYYFKCECPCCSELNLSDLVINAFRCAKPNCAGVVLEKVHFERRGDEILLVDHESNGFKFSLPGSEQDISKVASLLLEKPGIMCHIKPGYCLCCGSYLDLHSSMISSQRALSAIESLNESIVSNEAPDIVLDESLKSLGCLRSVRHQYSKLIAQAEDNVAQAFVKIGELEPAMQHCKASIEILEKLYHPKHVVIGNELLKLASIQISVGDHAAAVSSIERLEAIFSLYYGSHMTNVLPFVKGLRKEA